MAVHFAVFLITGFMYTRGEICILSFLGKAVPIFKSKEKDIFFFRVNWAIKGCEVNNAYQILHKLNAMHLRSFG